jgi:hypothetical protein
MVASKSPKRATSPGDDANVREVAWRTGVFSSTKGSGVTFHPRGMRESNGWRESITEGLASQIIRRGLETPPENSLLG